MNTTDQLIGQSEVLSILEDALKGSPADQTELVLVTDITDVTRYANSEIHQNVEQRNTRVAVRVAVGRAIARVFTNSLDIISLHEAIDDAVQVAKMQAPNPRFRSLPTPDTNGTTPAQSPQSYCEATANLSPGARAQAVVNITDTAEAAGMRAYGTYRSSVS